MRFFIYTLGCKVNHYESEALSGFLSGHGFSRLSSNEKADLIIVNSCTVTATSDQKTEKMLSKFRRSNPESIIALSGCMSQILTEENLAKKNADIIIGNNNHEELLEKINSYKKEKLISIRKHTQDERFSLIQSGYNSNHTRAELKIQDGCDRFCSYCIIPYTRGKSRSMDFEDVKIRLNEINQKGHKEVVLVGINLCCYGLDNSCNLVDVIKYANNLENIRRIRLGSLEYDNISDEFIYEISRIEKYCPHFHISLQSGSDKVLRDMGRKYTASQYLELINKIKDKMQDALFTTDIIVGFPTETEEDFYKTIRFAKNANFSKIHVFPYSVRLGTKAADMIQISGSEKKNRSRKLIDVAKNLRLKFLHDQVGENVQILTESKNGKYISGYTPNYIPISLKANDLNENEVVEVKITGVDEVKETCTGKALG